MIYITRVLRSAGWIVLTILDIYVCLIFLLFLFNQRETSYTILSSTDIRTPAVEYKDYVSILLTALSVMIALGSIFVASLAVIGFGEAKKYIDNLTSKTLENLVNERLSPAVERALEAERQKSAENQEGSDDLTDEEVAEIIKVLGK